MVKIPDNSPDQAAAGDVLRRIALHWPEISARIHPAVIYLYRARDLLLDNAAQALKPLGMHPSDLDVLGALRSQPAPWQLTPTELSRSLLLSSGGVTKILHRLEKKEWIDRPANPQDGRSRLVRLTVAGEGQLDRALEVVLAKEERHLSALTEAQMQQLGELLRALVGTWESQDT